MFCNNRKAQVVCYIDFVKVKAGMSKIVTVITKKGQTQDLCKLLVWLKMLHAPLQQLYLFCADYTVKQKRIKVYCSHTLSILGWWFSYEKYFGLLEVTTKNWHLFCTFLPRVGGSTMCGKDLPVFPIVMRMDPESFVCYSLVLSCFLICFSPDQTQYCPTDALKVFSL